MVDPGHLVEFYLCAHSGHEEFFHNVLHTSLLLFSVLTCFIFSPHIGGWAPGALLRVRKLREEIRGVHQPVGGAHQVRAALAPREEHRVGRHGRFQAGEPRCKKGQNI